MFHLENTNYLDKKQINEDGDLLMINQSSKINELAETLHPRYLEEVCDAFIPKEGKSKARINDMLSGLTCIFKVIKKADGKPVFLVQDNYNYESCTGFYFFIGTQQEVMNRIMNLTKDSWKIKDPHSY